MISVKYFIAMQTNLLVYHSDYKNITNLPNQFPFACLNHLIKSGGLSYETAKHRGLVSKHVARQRSLLAQMP